MINDNNDLNKFSELSKNKSIIIKKWNNITDDKKKEIIKKFKKKDWWVITEAEEKDLKLKYTLYWRIQRYLKNRFLRMSEENKKKFIEKYSGVVDLSYILLKPKPLIYENLKGYKIITSKKYKSLLDYKRSKLSAYNNKSKWDLPEEIWNKKFSNVIHFTSLHIKKYYTIKKTICFFYGFLKHKKLKKIFLEINRKKNRTLMFLLNLEKFLITALYRIGFVLSFVQAKQFIRHGFILVNNRQIVYRHYLLKKNDIISYNIKKYNNFLIKNDHLSQKLLKTFLYTKKIFSHYFVNKRAMVAIILYDPSIYYKMLLTQYPSRFFNNSSNLIVNTALEQGKNVNRSILFNRFIVQENQLKKEQKNLNKIRSFDKMFQDITKIYNDNKIPPQNIKLILSFLIKK